MPQFEKGDRVEYHPIGGKTTLSLLFFRDDADEVGRHGTSTSTGTIERVLTERDTAGSQHQHINASKEEPRYEVCEREHHLGRANVNQIQD